MKHLADLPLWIGVPVALLLVIGATLTLLGTLGLVRLRSFYDRLHAPTLGTSWGAAATLLASMILFSWTEVRAAVHELVLGVLVMVTTPVTLMLLGRAALHRDRAEGHKDVPPAVARERETSGTDGRAGQGASPRPALQPDSPGIFMDR